MSRLELEDIFITYAFIPGKRKETVAFLNGVMASYSSWEDVVLPFQQLGFSILLHDYRGQLLSGKPTTPFSFQTHSKDFNALLDHLDISKLHLVGTSYGSILGIDFTSLFPEKVLSLSLIDPITSPDPLFIKKITLWHTLCNDILTASPPCRHQLAKNLFSSVLNLVYSSRFLNTNQSLIRQKTDLFSQLPLDFFSGFKSLLENSLKNICHTQKFSELSCPVLISCGSDDILTPPFHSVTLHHLLPHCEFLLLPDAGHASFSEIPALTQSYLLGFILKNSLL